MSRLHLAGIIPVANLKCDFDLPTPDVLLPIGRGFTAIQKAVFECSMAGCNTIWIVANDDLAPVIRHSIGEWVYDPVYYRRPGPRSSEERREIPIYYVPIHPKDRERRDSYAWSVLHGIHSAWRVSYAISRWVVPEKYYISFPMAAHNVNAVREHRRTIGQPENNFFLTHEGLTVKDNLPLSFTMTGEDFKRCRRAVNTKTTLEYLPPAEGEKYPSQKLPLVERWSARQFTFKDVLEDIDEQHCTKVETDWFYDLSSWSGYRQFIASPHEIETPEEGLTKARRHVKLPYTEDTQ